MKKQQKRSFCAPKIFDFRAGQITIFMLIAIVFIILVGAMIYVVPNLLKPSNANVEVTNYITSCLQLTAQDALIAIGQQGGLPKSTRRPSRIKPPVPI